MVVENVGFTSDFQAEIQLELTYLTYLRFLQVSMAPSRVNKYLYEAIVSVLAIMPGMMSLLPPAIRHYMGTKDIGLKFGLVLTGEVSAHLVTSVLLTTFHAQSIAYLIGGKDSGGNKASY
jgi:hypothetical protein